MKNLTVPAPYENESIKEYAYRVIRENILNLSLTPGSKISEKEISVALSISRTPVREAFIRLSQQDLVEILPQRGTYISKINTEQIAEFRFLRLTLEQAIMQLACENFPEKSAADLKKCIGEQELCVENKDYSRFFELDNQMHSIIFNGCGKPNVWRIIQEANLNYIRSRILDLVARQSEISLLFKQHKLLAKAIFTKDQALGYKVATEHINKVIGDIDSLKKQHSDYFE